ncbi:uncharacterized protein GGS22DRAFT_149887 [Annulohypoxylon maeteangense]|uniref:uncharacterized protein n=1 Tax=Annulohypoxylon maeteangense TaxID=1927788 RepID=UPI002008BEB9|nr:uncharacterized protein GGS22DRAFT_149887 [Annulohypoxylon maeteangense]KAI0890059.1 hypothetical protein GGS22DRAFT_149887 [Annulohypoxylon maeteangense]
MAETSGASYRRDKKEFKELTDEKVRQIYVWRTEVEYSQTRCICSNPTMIEPEPAKKAKGESKGKGKGKAVARRGGHRTEASSSTAMESDIQPEPSQEPAAPREIPLTVGIFVREGDPCPMCKTPVNEGVLFSKIEGSGERAIVCTNASSRSMTSLNRISDVLSFRQYKTPPRTWLKRKARKPLEQIKRAVTPEDEKFKGKQVLKPLMDLLKRRSSLESVSSGPATVRPRATEMYHTVPSENDKLRARAGSVETLLSSLSDDDDDERGRPKLTIGESAARLRRAQRLLDKQNKSESKT